MEEVLKIENLCVEYRTGDTVAKALNHLDLTIHKGEALGLVGESGAGKTTTALTMLKLLPKDVGFVTDGKVLFHGENILDKNEKEMNEIRGGKNAMVFKNPLTSLNPIFTVGHHIAMVFEKHRHRKRKEPA